MPDTPLTPDQIERLRGLLADATPGPWETWCGATAPRVRAPARDQRNDHSTVAVTASHIGLLPSPQRLAVAEADAALIVALRNAAPALLDAAAQNVRLRKVAGLLLEALGAADEALKAADVAVALSQIDMDEIRAAIAARGE